MLEQCAKLMTLVKNKRKKREVGLGYFEHTKHLSLSFLIESISACNGLLLPV